MRRMSCFALAALLALVQASCAAVAAAAPLTFNSYGPWSLTVQSSLLYGSSWAGTSSTGGGGNSPLTGDGDAFGEGRLRGPRSVAFNPARGLVYTNDIPFNFGALKVIDVNADTISTVCGSQSASTVHTGACGLGGATGTGVLRWQKAHMEYDQTRDDLYVLDPSDFSIHRVDMSTYNPATAAAPTIYDVTQKNTAAAGSCSSFLTAGQSFSMSYNAATLQLCRPTWLSMDEARNILYVADYVFGGVIAINFQTNIVSSVIAGPVGSIAPQNISKIFYRPASNSLIVGSPDAINAPVTPYTTCNPDIAVWHLTTSTVTDYPAAVMRTLNNGGSCIYTYYSGVDDYTLFTHGTNTGQINLFNFSSNTVTAIAGVPFSQDFGPQMTTTEGPSLTSAWFVHPSVTGMYYDDASTTLYLADPVWNRITSLNVKTLTSSWVAGGGPTGGGYLDGPPGVGALRAPYMMHMWPASKSLMFIDGYSYRVRQVFLANQSLASVIGGGGSTIGHLDDCPNAQAVGPNIKRTMALSLQTAAIDPLNPMNMFIPNHMCTIYLNLTSNYASFITYTNQPPSLPGIQVVYDHVVTSDGQTMFQSLQWNHTGAAVIVRNKPQNPNSRMIWSYDIICGFGNTAAAPGTDGACSNQAKISSPRGFAIDEANKRLYFADGTRIRYLWPYDSDTPSVTTLIGSTQGYADGTVATTRFYFIQTIRLGVFKGVPVMFATDNNNFNVRMIDMTDSAAPVCYTIAGPNTTATIIEQNYREGFDHDIRFNGPFGMAYDGVDTLYVGDRGNNKIRILSLITPDDVVPSSSTGSASIRSSSTGRSSASSSTAIAPRVSSSSTGGRSISSSSGVSSSATSRVSSSSTGSKSASSSTATRSSASSSSSGRSVGKSSSTGSSATGSATGDSGSDTAPAAAGGLGSSAASGSLNSAATRLIGGAWNLALVMFLAAAVGALAA